MATSGSAIKAAIETKLVAYAAAEGVAIDLANAPLMRALLKAVGDGLYEELQKLQDTAGNPPSTGHL